MTTALSAQKKQKWGNWSSRETSQCVYRFLFMCEETACLIQKQKRDRKAGRKEEKERKGKLEFTLKNFIDCKDINAREYIC